MAYLRFLLVSANTAMFVGILLASLGSRRAEALPGVRRLWLVVALISGAIVLGSAQRLLLLAGDLGWVTEDVSRLTSPQWQLAQSVVVSVLGALAFVSVRRVAMSIGDAERLMHRMIERVRGVNVEQVELSPREDQVLRLMGSGLVTDAELAHALHISPSTVQTHVKSLLRKTDLHRRQDLMFAAGLLLGRGDEP